jgi:hypothetical protein
MPRMGPRIPPDAERCIYDHVPRKGDWGTRRCERRGVIERDGKLYCRQHDSVAVQERRDASHHAAGARWDAEAKEQRVREHKLATWDALLEALKNSLYLLEPYRYEWNAAYTAIEAAEKEPTS